MTFAAEDVTLTPARSADEGLSVARQSPPDLVIADAVMPGRSGYDLCAAIKADRALANVPVLILASPQNPYDEARGRQVSADGHLIKPFDSGVMIARVLEVLGKADLASGLVTSAVGGSANLSPMGIPVPAAGSEYDEDDYGEITIDAMPARETPRPAPYVAPAPVIAPGFPSFSPQSPPPASAHAARAPGLSPPLSAPLAPPAAAHLSAAPAPVAAPGMAPAPALGPGLRPSLIPGVRPGLVPGARPGIVPVAGGSLARPAPVAPALSPPGVLSPAGVSPVAAQPLRPARAPVARTMVGMPVPRPGLSLPVPLPPARPGTGPVRTLAQPHGAGTAPVSHTAQPSHVSASQAHGSLVDQKVAEIAARGPEYEVLAKLSREVIEKIVWEIVPELTEAIVREELRRRGQA